MRPKTVMSRWTMPETDTIWVVIENARWQEAVHRATERCQQAALAALAAAGPATENNEREAVILLADDATLHDLNVRFRDEDKATNVLSFPRGDDALLPKGAAVPLGDVAIAFETARREAAAEGKSLADHLSHLVVHGMLHLLGYDHQCDEEAERMESLEVEVLAKLGIESPYGQRLAG
jgi:probable rRNA maturation factor